MSNARFLRVWLAGMAFVLALVAVIDISVDPYDVFGWARRPGLNFYKPATKNHSVLTKTRQLARYRPATVLLGTSRAYVGFDAASRFWPPADRPVYNAGLPGTTLSGMRDMLRTAVATGGVRTAIVLLDFDSFLTPDAPPAPAGAPAWLGEAQDMFLSVFTLAALRDSITTIAEQHLSLPPDLHSDGTSVEAEFARWARDDGYQELFSAKLETLARQVDLAARAVTQWHGGPNNMDVLADMIRICREHGIALDLAFSPSHRMAQDLYIGQGLLPRIEAWKRAVVTLAASAGDQQVRVWDFTGYSPQNTEPLPTARGGTMQWWWEPVHFTKALGDLMIRRISGDETVDYGVEVTPATIDNVLTQYRERRDAVLCQTGAAKCPSRRAEATLPQVR